MERQEKIEKVKALMADFRSGMLVTHGLEDRPHARPMMIAAVDENLTVSFVTALDSLKVEEIQRREYVALTFQSSGAFVSLSGRATIVTDPEEKKNAWHPVAGLWFQQPEDDDAALVKLQPESVEYWDQRGVNSVRLAFEALRAVATGVPPTSSTRTHGQVDL